MALDPDMSPSTQPSVTYKSIIQFGDLRVPFVPGIITPKIEKPLRSGRYERGERQLLTELLRPDDRVLDLGAGIGVVGAAAARCVPDGSVMSVEAQPNLIPFIREIWSINGVLNAELRHAAVMKDGGDPVDFFVRTDFWASSFEPNSRPYQDIVPVPSISVGQLIDEFDPTVISCDIEGAEEAVFDATDLSRVRAIILETHPKVYGEATRDALLEGFTKIGLHPRPQDKPSTVFVLERAQSNVVSASIGHKASSVTSPTRSPSDEAPNVLIATCMKDEGPFILEWLAWHKAIGITDFVVFSNDCTDGSDALLDRLDELGELTHLPNPASVQLQDHFQPSALKFVQSMPVFHRSDYFISLDVDEFMNIRTADGSIGSLLQNVDQFDVLSANELLHGSNGQEHFQRGWVTEIFPRHATLIPDDENAKTGVKSISRLTDRIQTIRNHRPDLREDIADPRWLDGSGKQLSDFIEEPDRNGIDGRGRRDLITIHHFSLRSLESYLVKMFRGDVVVARRRVAKGYWRKRNLHVSDEVSLASGIARAKDVYRRFEADPKLMSLHESCCAAHEARIQELLQLEEYQQRRDWIFRKAW